MRRTLHIRHLLFILAVLSISAGCGVGGPGDTGDAEVPPGRDAGVDAEVTPDARIPTVTPITVQTLRSDFTFTTLGQTYIDMREDVAECQRAHLFGANCVPATFIWNNQTQDFVQSGRAITTQAPVKTAPLIFYSTDADEATVMAVATASLGLGYEEIYWVQGGIDAWRSEGWFFDTSYQGIVNNYYDLQTPSDPLVSGVYLFDNMDATAYENDGHIAGAVLLDTNYLYYDDQLVDSGNLLLTLAPPGSTDVLIFYCVNWGCEASIGASEAAEILGYTEILHYHGGYEDWVQRGGPVSFGPNP